MAYYLAKMITAGEDPRFIARRIVICASEDVGNADPMALTVAECTTMIDACRESGIDPHWYAHRPRGEREVFPWDHVDGGVHKALQWAEYVRAGGGDTTGRCCHGSR